MNSPNRGQSNFGRNYNRKDGQNIGIDEKAQTYFPHIKLLLEIETSSTSDIKKGIEKIENLVKNNNTVTTHQIRNIFKIIMDANSIRELNKIRPKLAYISARQRGDHGKVIAKVIDELIVDVTTTAEIKQNEKLKGLKYIMESIVAYHKFHVKEK